MSVLIEALTLVVPKQVLDVGYPGGTDAFLQALRELENPRGDRREEAGASRVWKDHELRGKVTR